MLEHLLIRRSYPKVAHELYLLNEHISRDKWNAVVQELVVLLPTLDEALMDEALSLLVGKGVGWRSRRLARVFRRRLRPYARRSRVRASLVTTVRFADKILGKLLGRGSRKKFADGGCVIAFVGPEASGKSSIVEAVSDRLGIGVQTLAVHFGKPPATLASFPSRLLLPLARKLAPRARTTEVALVHPSGASERLPSLSGPSYLLFAIRSVLIAWDRRALARRTSRVAGSGALVLTDRYPCTTPGRADGPRLAGDSREGLARGLGGWLIRQESLLYASVPPPDTVVRLQVPLETAVSRNRIRVKDRKESEGYVTARHSLVGEYPHPHTKCFELSTEGELDQVLREACSLVWGSLQA